MDPNEEEQRKKKSGIDYLNEGANRGRNAYKTFKRVQGAVKLARGAGAAAQGTEIAAGAAATSEVWVPVLIVALLIFLIILIFVIVSGAVGVNQQTGQQDEVATPSGQLAKCTSLQADPVGCLKSDFNVIVRGTSNKADLIRIYTIFASTNSTTYATLLAGDQPLYINIYGGTSNCISVTSENQIDLHCFFTRGLPYASQRYLLIHESGHALARRNPRVFQAFPWSSLLNSDPTCYSGGFLKSYPLRYTCRGVNYSGITAKSESFAEAMADTLTYNSYRPPSGFYCAVALPSFPSQCDNTYNWITNNIYK